VVTIRTTGGQVLLGTLNVCQLNFTATSGQPSTFAPLVPSGITATLSGGQAVPTCLAVNGEAVLVGSQSLVKTRLKSNGKRDLVLYGPAGGTFAVESSYTPFVTNVWTPEVTSGVMPTTLSQTFTNFTSGNLLKYYRSRSL
jgi:hypothetical protein